MGTAEATPQPVGAIQVPGRVLRDLRVNHQGTRMVTTWYLVGPDGEVKAADLYTSTLRGHALVPLTATGRAALAHWSPDDRYIAWEWDTSLTCTGWGCEQPGGSCSLVWAPANSPGLTLRDPDVVQFRIHDAQGRPGIKSCSLMGWTP